MQENEQAPVSAVAEYSPTVAALADLRQRMAKVAYDVATPAGMLAAKKDRAEVRSLRTSLEAKRVEIKSPALERCRLIDAEAKRITAELVAIEEPIDQQIKAEEARRETERQAKALAEVERIAAIQSRIDAMRDLPASMVGKSAAEIAGASETLAAIVIDGEFAELTVPAAVAKGAALASLETMRAAALAMEEEAARLAEQRRQLEAEERAAARRRETERIQREAEAAEAARIAKAEQEAAAEKLRIEREAFEREQAAAKAKADAEQEERDRIAAEARAKADEAARIAREEADRVAAEARAKREAEEKVEADARAKEKAELDRRQAEIDAREKAERERVEAAQRAEAEKKRKAEEAKEAKAREARKAAQEVADAESLLATFCDRFGHLPQFAGVVAAIWAVGAAEVQS